MATRPTQAEQTIERAAIGLLKLTFIGSCIWLLIQFVAKVTIALWT